MLDMLNNLNNTTTDIDPTHAILNIQKKIAEEDRTDALLRAKQFVSIFKNDPRGWIVLGTVYQECGLVKDALKCWENAYELDSLSDEISFYLLSGLYENSNSHSALAKALLDKLQFTSKEICFASSAANIPAITACLVKRGMVVIRNCLNKDVIAKWEENRKQNCELLGMEDCELTMPGLFIAEQENKQEFYNKYKNGFDDGDLWTPKNYTQSHIEQISLKLNTMIVNAGLNITLCHFLGKNNISPWLDYSMARHFKGGHDGVGHYHQDARLQKRQDLFVTLWMPFVACGGFKGPTLTEIPIRFQHYFPAPVNQHVTFQIPNELCFSPEFEPGDLLIHSTYTIHGGCFRKEMQGWRSSFDIRYF